MKIRLILCAFTVLSFISCKDNKVAEDSKTIETEKVTENKNSFSLSNLSDDNWKNGVGITYKMFLTDFSKEKEELIKNGKTLELPDGQSVPYVGYEVAGQYIQIFLNDEATKYSAAAEYPNVITVK